MHLVAKILATHPLEREIFTGVVFNLKEPSQHLCIFEMRIQSQNRGISRSKRSQQRPPSSWKEAVAASSRQKPPREARETQVSAVSI